MAKVVKIEVGNEVAFNNLKDATWFTVEKINGLILTVREVGTMYKAQTIDSSCVAQVRASASARAAETARLRIASRGALTYAERDTKRKG